MGVSNRQARGFHWQRILLAAAVLGVSLVLSACMTGERFSGLQPGMTKTEVVGRLGNPNGYEAAGTSERLTWSNRMMSGWSYDRADYHVILNEGRVASYGTGTVRQNRGPAGAIVLVPLRAATRAFSR